MKNGLKSPRVFNYISLSKVASLEKSLKKIQGGGLSVLGVGGTLNVSREASLQDRVNAIIDEIPENSVNFKKFDAKFVEVIMDDVVVYVSSTKEHTIIMGGSAAYTQFNDKRNPPVEYVGGSNRSALASRMTRWWQEYYLKKETINKDNTNGLQMTLEDLSFETLMFHREPGRLMYIADWMHDEYAFSHLVGNMEMLSIIYTDISTLPIFGVLDGKPVGEKKKRLVIGSPLYVCQTSPITQ